MSERGRDQIKKDLTELKTHLLQSKDELLVQMNLAKMEAKDELAKLEKPWHDFLAKVKDIIEDAGEFTEDAVESAEKLGHNLKDKYQEIKEKIKD
jgi:dsDNA-specific endonuclease/ATPase MutS2